MRTILKCGLWLIRSHANWKSITRWNRPNFDWGIKSDGAFGFEREVRTIAKISRGFIGFLDRVVTFRKLAVLVCLVLIEISLCQHFKNHFVITSRLKFFASQEFKGKEHNNGNQAHNYVETCNLQGCPSCSFRIRWMASNGVKWHHKNVESLNDDHNQPVPHHKWLVWEHILWEEG